MNSPKEDENMKEEMKILKEEIKRIKETIDFVLSPEIGNRQNVIVEKQTHLFCLVEKIEERSMNKEKQYEEKIAILEEKV